jgi:hypothetical protein
VRMDRCWYFDWIRDHRAFAGRSIAGIGFVCHCCRSSGGQPAMSPWHLHHFFGGGQGSADAEIYGQRRSTARLTLEVGTRERFRLLCNVVQVDILGKLLFPEQNLENRCRSARTISQISPLRSLGPGRSTRTRLGSRRSTASSKANGLLVAPTTTSLLSLFAEAELSPSSSCMNSVKV